MVSPHSPYARATLIEHDWDKVKDQVGQWEKEAGDSPTLLAALARRDTDLKKPGEAERCSEELHQTIARLLGLQPARRKLKATWRSQTLAGDSRRVPRPWGRPWPRPRQGRRRPRRAFHAAKALGQSVALRRIRRRDLGPMGDGLRSAMGGGDGEMGRSCAMGPALTERYPESDWAMWYLCCKRTGHGDVDGARATLPSRTWRRSAIPTLSEHSSG